MIISITLPPEADRTQVERWLTQIPCELVKVVIENDLDCHRDHPLSEVLDAEIFSDCAAGTCKCRTV